MEKEKRQRKHDGLLRLVKVINVVLMTIPFALAWHWYYNPQSALPYQTKGNLLVVVIFVALYCTYVNVYDGLAISMSRAAEIVYSQGLAAFISTAIMYIVSWLLIEKIPNVIPYLIAFFM